MPSKMPAAGTTAGSIAVGVVPRLSDWFATACTTAGGVTSVGSSPKPIVVPELAIPTIKDVSSLRETRRW